MAEVLSRLGSTHSLVVHGEDGLDEVTLTGTTSVHEVAGGKVRSWTIDPREYGMALVARQDLAGGDATHNAAIARSVLGGKPSAYRTVVELNAAAAMLAADRVSSLAEGIDLARQTIESGAALKKLDQVAATSQRLKQAAVASTGTP
jgi:anthranilate phosphoribosyltransferase